MGLKMHSRRFLKRGGDTINCDFARYYYDVRPKGVHADN